MADVTADLAADTIMLTEAKLFANNGASFELVDVLLDIDGQMRYTIADGSVIIAHKDQLKISDKLGSVPREVIMPNSDLLVLASDAQVDDWLAVSKKGVSRLERSPKFIFACVLAVPLCLYFIFAVAVPGLAVVFAPYIPESVVEMSSNHTLKTLDTAVLNPSQSPTAQTDALAQNWRTLMESMSLEHPNYTILFRNSEFMGPNAFALPNGTIVFTDQLLDLVEYDEDILTAIFMHEIGHVEQHHSMRLVSQAIVSSIAINYFIGDVGALVDIFASAGNTIVTNQFTQKLEWEADNFALKQLQLSGRDPVDFAKGMQKFSELSDRNPGEFMQLFSSHPLTEERIYNALEAAGLPKEYRDKLVTPSEPSSQ